MQPLATDREALERKLAETRSIHARQELLKQLWRLDSPAGNTHGDAERSQQLVEV